jgi:excisionase family DNA binding protein
MSLPHYARMDQTQKIAVSVREAAAMLSISPRTIQNYIAAKLLPARKIGRRTVIPVRALEAFLRSDHASLTRVVDESVGAGT